MEYNSIKSTPRCSPDLSKTFLYTSVNYKLFLCFEGVFTQKHKNLYLKYSTGFEIRLCYSKDSR